MDRQTAIRTEPRRKVATASIYWWATALSIIMAIPSGRCVAEEQDPDFHPMSFLNEHCLGCHGRDEQKGDRRFDKLQFTATTEEALGQWQEILDAVNRGDMPPEDAPDRLPIARSDSSAP